MDGKIERARIEDRAPLSRRGSPPPEASLGEVARDVVDHAQVIARDALAIGKLSAKRAVDQATSRARDVAPRIAFGAVASVAALTGVIFLLIAAFIALGDPIPSLGWRLAIFGIFFLLVAVVAALFAGSHQQHSEHEAPQRVFAGARPETPLPRPALPPEPRH